VNMPATPDLAPARPPLEFRAQSRVLASDWQSRLRYAPLGAWVAAIGLLVFGALRDPSAAGWLVSAAVLVVILAGPQALSRVNVLVRITSELVEYRGLLRMPRRCSRVSLTRLVQVRTAVLGPRFVFTRLLLVDASGRARISVQTEWFSPSDLETLQAALAVPVSATSAPVSPRALNRMHPGAASFLLVHRYEAVAILALLALLVIGLLIPAHRG
jgi:hypothetical protein